ncbi:MAG: hypothetical protein ACK4IK_06175 [Bacteroidia bacterium]
MQYFKIILVILFLNNVSICLLAQNGTIDSLKNIVNVEINDTNKVYHLLELSELFYEINVDSAYYYVDKAYQLVLNLNDSNYIAMSLGELAWYVFEKVDFYTAKNYYQKAF